MAFEAAAISTQIGDYRLLGGIRRRQGCMELNRKPDIVPPLSGIPLTHITA